MQWTPGLALVAALAGCGGGPPVATAIDASRANVALADLQEGRTLMLARCSGCHHTPMPSDHPAGEWPRQVDAMAERAKLDGSQRQLIVQYLVTMATR